MVLFLDAEFVPLSGNVSGYGLGDLVLRVSVRSGDWRLQSSPRHLDPAFGCWLSRDPAPLPAKRLSLYGYGHHNPGNSTDRSGYA